MRPEWILKRLLISGWLLVFGLMAGWVYAGWDEVKSTLQKEVDARVSTYGSTHLEAVLVRRGEGPVFFSLHNHTPKRYRIASLTKTFTALGLLRLEDAGYLSTETPVFLLDSSLVPPHPWQMSDPVRVSHLLEHTSGLEDVHFNELYVQEGEKFPPLKTVLARNSNRKIRWRPGSRAAYSNAGYVIAGRIAEVVTGQDYENWMAETVLEPLGMQNTGFHPSIKDAGPGLPDDDPTTNKMIYMRPAAGMWSTAEDMAQLLQVFADSGKIGNSVFLSPERMREMVTPTTTPAAQKGFPVGFARGVENGWFQGLWHWGHRGTIDGFRSSYRWFPGEEFGFVVMMNGDVPGKVVNEVESLLLSAALDFPEEKLVEATKMQWGNAPPAHPYLFQPEFSGHYMLVSPRYELLYFLDRLTGGMKVEFAPDRLRIEGIALEPGPVPGYFLGKDNRAAAAWVGETPDLGKVLVFQGKTYQKVNPWKLRAEAIVLCLLLVLVISQSLYALGSQIARIWRKVPALGLRWLQGLPGLVLVLGIWIANGLKLVDMGYGSWREIAVFVLGILFAGLCLMNLGVSVLLFVRKSSSWNRFAATVSGLSGTILTLYLIFQGLIGIMLWEY